MSALQFALILNFCESVHDMISQSVQTLACFLSVDARILARDVFVTELYRIGGVLDQVFELLGFRLPCLHKVQQMVQIVRQRVVLTQQRELYLEQFLGSLLSVEADDFVIKDRCVGHALECP